MHQMWQLRGLTNSTVCHSLRPVLSCCTPLMPSYCTLWAALKSGMSVTGSAPLPAFCASPGGSAGACAGLWSVCILSMPPGMKADPASKLLSLSAACKPLPGPRHAPLPADRICCPSGHLLRWSGTWFLWELRGVLSCGRGASRMEFSLSGLNSASDCGLDACWGMFPVGATAFLFTLVGVCANVSCSPSLKLPAASVTSGMV